MKVWRQSIAILVQMRTIDSRMASQKRKADASTKLVTDGVEHDKIMHSPEEMDETFENEKEKMV